MILPFSAMQHSVISSLCPAPEKHVPEKKAAGKNAAAFRVGSGLDV